MDNGFNVFSHIYCMNLARCVDRKEHMVKEFARMGVSTDKYTITVGVDGYEHIDKIKKLKIAEKNTCFRCHQPNCNHTNKKLHPGLLGNWMSHIEVWQSIIEKNQLLALICEDDIHFANFAPDVLAKIFCKKTFEKYGIKVKNPILFRMGYGRARVKGRMILRWPDAVDNPVLTKQKKMSNPCYAVTLSFAEKLVNSLKVISNTCDNYVHKKMADKKNHFSIYPPIAHDLSLSIGEFESTINPKPVIRTLYLEKLKKTLDTED